jgi:hypothetical protein
MIKPKIKFNNGNPVALCNDCDKILCYVQLNDFNKTYSVRQYFSYDLVNLKIGDAAPCYCSKCVEINNNLKCDE